MVSAPRLSPATAPSPMMMFGLNKTPVSAVKLNTQQTPRAAYFGHSFAPAYQANLNSGAAVKKTGIFRQMGNALFGQQSQAAAPKKVLNVLA